MQFQPLCRDISPPLQGESQQGWWVPYAVEHMLQKEVLAMPKHTFSNPSWLLDYSKDYFL